MTIVWMKSATNVLQGLILFQSYFLIDCLKVLPIVGGLSVIPLLVSFYPLVYFVKDYDERFRICDDGSLSRLNLGKLYTYSGQQLALLVVLGAVTVGLLFSTFSTESQEQSRRNALLQRQALPEGAASNRQER